MYILQHHAYLPLWGMKGFPSTVSALLFSNINIVWALPWQRKTTFISKAVFICCQKRISFQFHYILATCYGPTKSYRLLFTQELTLTPPVLQRNQTKNRYHLHDAHSHLPSWMIKDIFNYFSPATKQNFELHTYDLSQLHVLLDITPSLPPHHTDEETILLCYEVTPCSNAREPTSHWQCPAVSVTLCHRPKA